MKELKGIEHYTPEYDDVMSAELEIIKDAYNYEKYGIREKAGFLLYPKYSIKLPNKMTGLSLHETSDGQQPAYHSDGYLNMLEQYDIYHDESIADYPRHGDTKRIFYKDLEKAQAALYYLKKHNDYINQKETA